MALGWRALDDGDDVVVKLSLDSSSEIKIRCKVQENKVQGPARLAVQQPGFSPAARLDGSAVLEILFLL
ncbi:hypothetical protein Tco_1048037 [Tanacetum coccineum]